MYNIQSDQHFDRKRYAPKSISSPAQAALNRQNRSVAWGNHACLCGVWVAYIDLVPPTQPQGRLDNPTFEQRTLTWVVRPVWCMGSIYIELVPLKSTSKARQPANSNYKTKRRKIWFEMVCSWMLSDTARLVPTIPTISTAPMAPTKTRLESRFCTRKLLRHLIYDCSAWQATPPQPGVAVDAGHTVPPQRVRPPVVTVPLSYHAP